MANDDNMAARAGDVYDYSGIKLYNGNYGDVDASNFFCGSNDFATTINIIFGTDRKLVDSGSNIAVKNFDDMYQANKGTGNWVHDFNFDYRGYRFYDNDSSKKLYDDSNVGYSSIVDVDRAVELSDDNELAGTHVYHYDWAEDAAHNGRDYHAKYYILDIFHSWFGWASDCGAGIDLVHQVNNFYTDSM